MPGENANLALFAQFVERQVDPAQALDIVRVDPHAHTHAGLAHPDVVGLEVIFQGEVPQHRVFRAEYTGEGVIPQVDLVE